MDSTMSRAPLVTYDEGLRAFLISVYNRLGLGVLITAAFAWIAGNTPFGDALYHLTAKGKIDYTMLGWVVCFGPLALILLMGFVLKNTNSKAGSAFLYYTSTVLFGLSTGVLFKIYTGASLGLTLAITATMFGGLSLWGYTTKKNLSGIGNFLVAALVGVIVAVFVSFLIPALNIVICGVGILLFSAFIAYDTQRLKNTYSELQGAGEEELATAANMSAFNLFLDVINLFQFLLPIFGSRK